MTENNHIYLNDLPTNPTLKETNYSNHLLKEISPYLNKQFSNNFSENNIPRATHLNEAYNILHLFKSQGFIASISGSEKYLITCNPFHS
ncbi:MAG: hypothetical protein VXX85_03935, partial [Candidatus Margulisiibacteriota bacterium]|nr:hypothetical protein [Candidatus Margulisiibacteriota bacterium]